MINAKTIILVKGDSISLESDIDTDITGWKLRAEIFDDQSHCIKLATSNVTGGSDDQIEILNATTSKSNFIISVPEGATECFEKESQIEIEAETVQTVGGKVEKITIFKGKIIFESEEITWDDVST